MTQKKSDSISPFEDDDPVFRSTRIENAEPDLFDPDVPRIGRRESEPHSSEVTYIHDVLSTNFPEGRTIWDLHHYFIGLEGVLKGDRIDIQFDISFFKKLEIKHTLSSFDAVKYENQVPEMVINVLSKSTWRADLSDNLETCKELGIKVYVVFSPFKVAKRIYNPPFLRAYVLQQDKSYKEFDLRKVTLDEGGKIQVNNIIDLGNLLPFRLGLMKLQKNHEGDLPLYRLIFLKLSEPEILATEMEMKLKEAEIKAKEAEIKAKEAETKAKEAEKKVIMLEETLIKYKERFGEL